MNELIQNRSETDRFLTVVDEEVEDFCFRTLDDNKERKDPSLTRVFYGSVERYFSELCALNNRGAGVFVVFNETDGNGKGQKKKNIKRLRGVFIENDSGTVPKLPIEPQLVIETSKPNGKSHTHSYFLTSCENVDEFENIQQRLVDDYGSDPNAKDRARILRVPGFYHMKNPKKPRLVRIISESGMQPYKWEQIKQAFPPVIRKVVTPLKHLKHSFGKSTVDLDELMTAAKYIPMGKGQYLNWITVGQAIHSVFPDDYGLSIWDKLSVEEDNYCGFDVLKNKHWISFTSGKGVGLGSLFHLAMKNGYTKPKKAVRPVPPVEVYEDDLSVNGGNVVELSEYKKKRKSSVKSNKVEEDSVLAGMIAPDLDNQVGFDSKTLEWMQKNNNYWSAISDENFLFVLFAKMSEILPDGFSNSKLKAVKELLKIFLVLPEWESDRLFLPLENGILNTKTNQLTPYTPDRFFRYQLPYCYDSEAKCYKTLAWLGDITEGDETKTAILQAFTKALLTGKKIQKFLEIIGPGGTGKSTFVTLLTNLIGGENTVSTDLYNLEKNQFETANLYGKFLAVISDADIYGGGVSVLKALTGGDSLRYERKNQQQGAPFVYEGILVMVSNQASQTTDYSSGMARRRLPVYLKKKVTDEDKKTYQSAGGIDSVLKSELPGFLNWALSMSDEEMYDSIQSISKGLSSSELEHLCDTNKLAAWIDENLVIDESVALYIGKKGDPEGERFKLYPNYLTWCRQTGVNPIGLRNFTNNLSDLCQSLSIKGERLPRNKHGFRFLGLAIRDREDVKYKEYATPITQQILVDDGRV